MSRYHGGKKLRVHAIAGTRVVLMALDADDSVRSGLRGFAFWRETPDILGSEGKWLRSSKVFQSVEPNPKQKIDGKPKVFRTNKHPIQSFLWSDYGAEPNTRYRFKIVPMYSDPGNLTPGEQDAVSFEIRTEKEDDGKHGIWFNRGAIASQYFAREFGNPKPTLEEIEDINNKYTKWLSRNLAEACVGFINSTQEGQSLRACVYEFTYKPVIDAFRDAVQRGIDVKIIYHKTAANDKAIDDFGLPRKVGSKQILIERTRPKTPHNKYIILLDAQNNPQSVWTGSTNITPSGFCGQSNVGHLVHDSDVARKFLSYWKLLSDNPTGRPAKDGVVDISPHPDELLPPSSTTLVFSPRENEALLFWYGNRMLDATNSMFFTAAFDVSPRLWEPLSRPRNYLRYLLLEQPPTAELRKKVIGRDLHVRSSYGAVLGQKRIRIYPSDGQQGGVKVVELENFELENWFWREEHSRSTGHVFFVHTKYLLIDPLGDDPAVITGSANFSKSSLVNNDENMLLIRGDTRVADIYFTEFDRLFRHFIFRNMANENADEPGAANVAFLEERNGKDWTAYHFASDRPNSWRRQMFFAKPPENWTDSAGRRRHDESVMQDAAAAEEDKQKKKKPPSKPPSKKKVAKTKTTKKVEVKSKKATKAKVAKKIMKKKSVKKKSAKKLR